MSGKRRAPSMLLTAMRKKVPSQGAHLTVLRGDSPLIPDRD
jgi:hypothetical protein